MMHSVNGCIDGFLTLAEQEPERIQLVDANQSIEAYRRYYVRMCWRI